MSIKDQYNDLKAQYDFIEAEYRKAVSGLQSVVDKIKESLKEYDQFAIDDYDDLSHAFSAVKDFVDLSEPTRRVDFEFEFSFKISGDALVTDSDLDEGDIEDLLTEFDLEQTIDLYGFGISGIEEIDYGSRQVSLNVDSVSVKVQ